MPYWATSWHKCSMNSKDCSGLVSNLSKTGLCRKHRLAKSQRKAYDPKKNRAYKLMSYYNLTESEYNAMFLSQKGKCALCERFVGLIVDHDHKTGRVRGLLCKRCNTLLGMLENIGESAITKALEYINFCSHKSFGAVSGTDDLLEESIN